MSLSLLSEVLANRHLKQIFKKIFCGSLIAAQCGPGDLAFSTRSGKKFTSYFAAFFAPSWWFQNSGNKKTTRDFLKTVVVYLV